MATRRLPYSNVSRQRSLEAAVAKQATLAPDQQLLSPTASGRLAGIAPPFTKAMAVSAAAAAKQIEATATANMARATLKTYVSHFHQVFGLGVVRGLHTPNQKSYFGLPASGESLPALGTESEILQAAQHIVDGDERRMADGGVAMSNPSTAEVGDALADFKLAIGNQTKLKDAFDRSQEAVQALVAEADSVIKRVWDEVEMNYNDEAPASKRRKAREWGVNYISDTTISIVVAVTDQATGLPIPGVLVEITETGDSQLTEGDGTATLVTHAMDAANLVFNYAGYATASKALVLDNAQGQYTVALAMAKL